MALDIPASFTRTEGKALSRAQNAEVARGLVTGTRVQAAGFVAAVGLQTTAMLSREAAFQADGDPATANRLNHIVDQYATFVGMTGLYDAKLDGAPVLAISGQVPSVVRGRGAFQDLDLSAVLRDVSLSTVTVEAGSAHAELAATAVKRAIDGRGVTHIVLPDEVQEQPSDAPALAPDGRLARPGIAPPSDSFDAAEARVRAAKRPVLIVGQGARHAAPALRALAELLRAPVLTSFRAKGLVPDSHPLGAGVLGRSGTPVASWLMNEADLLFVVGASFANHTGIATYKPIAQIDDSATAIGRFNAVEIGVLGDAAVTVGALVDRLRVGGTAATDQRADVAARWALWRAEKLRRAEDDRGSGVASAAVFDALTRHCPADAVITVDVGNNAYSFGRYFESSGQPVLMSGYLGSIGFGYPAAMGAWAADPARPVVAVTGDGGFGQYLAEVTTAVKYAMPIKHVLLDNGALGKISKEQLAGDLPVWQTSLVNPDFAGYARACGAVGISVRAASELDEAMKALFAADGPALLHVHADAELV